MGRGPEGSPVFQGVSPLAGQEELGKVPVMDALSERSIPLEGNFQWASLVVQWLRIHLPRQGTWV